MEQSNGTVLYESKQPKEKWEEKEIREMISIWGTKEVLVNSKHPLYYNTKERTRAVEEIRNELAERGNEFTFKQVNDKMINLRTYYGSQRRQIEASKRHSISSESVFISRWKFFDSLKFLSDAIISRSAVDVSRADSGSENGSSLSPVSTATPTPQVNKPIETTHHRQKRKYSSHQLLCSRDDSIENTPENKQSKINNRKGKSQDEIFGELITAMVAEIPDCQEKAILKLDIQHKIIATRYKTGPLLKSL